MYLHKRILPKDHRIVLISDIHIGTKAHHRKGFLQALEMAKEPNTYLCFLGDHIEAIAIDDPRYDPVNLDPDTPSVSLQYKTFADLIEPHADKILVIMKGNHEDKVERRFGSLTKDIVCSRIATKQNRDADWLYGDYVCKLSIEDKKGDLQYKMFLHHGRWNVNSTVDDEVKRQAAMLGTLKKKLERKAGDCAIMAHGHTHKLLVREPQKMLYLTDDGDNVKDNYFKLNQNADFIHPESRWYVNTGCFYKTVNIGDASYAEIAGYDPNVLGFPVIHVKGGVIQNIEEIIL